MREYIPYHIRKSILDRDNYTCRYCGSKNSPFHLDHVYPVIKGGETSEQNLVTSCVSCNQKKHSSVGIWPKPIGYFEQSRAVKVEKVSNSLLFFLFALFLNSCMFYGWYVDYKETGQIGYYSVGFIVLFLYSLVSLLKSLLLRNNKSNDIEYL